MSRNLNDAQLRRISIVSDWFGDPQFMTGGDSVCLIAESRSQIHPRIARLPQLLAVEVPAPSTEQRMHYIEHFQSVGRDAGQAVEHAQQSRGIQRGTVDPRAASIVGRPRPTAIEPMEPADVVLMVQQYIQSQLGRRCGGIQEAGASLGSGRRLFPAEAILARENDSASEDARVKPRCRVPRSPVRSAAARRLSLRRSRPSWICRCWSSRAFAANGSARRM